MKQLRESTSPALSISVSHVDQSSTHPPCVKEKSPAPPQGQAHILFKPAAATGCSRISDACVAVQREEARAIQHLSTKCI